MSLAAPELFTAAIIARSLGRAPSSIRQTLANIAPDGSIEISGNAANAWQIGSIPASLREEMARRAQKRRLPNIEALMNETANPWKPPFPLAECLPTDVEKAKKLKRAWEGTIDRMRSPALLPGELARRGIEDYKREFGFEITERHWNTLHERLLTRAGDAEEFGRLEIYLDDNVRKAKSDQGESNFARPLWLEEVEHAIVGFADPAKLTTTEETFLWVRVMEAIAHEHKNGVGIPALKRAAVGYLICKLPGIAKTSEALRKQVDRQWRVFLESGGNIQALGDQRPAKSGFFRTPDLTAESCNNLIAFASQCGGRISQAWRVLRKKGLLDPEIAAYYAANPQNKSWVPKQVRSLIKSEVKEDLTRLHGPRNDELTGLSTPGDWSATYANEAFQADDVTLNHYVWMNDPHTGETIVTRGQCLVMADTRSRKILNFVFLDSKSYDSFSIHGLMKRTCLAFGNPSIWAFERGLWMKSRLVVGNQNAQHLSYEEADVGFRKYGMQFSNSITPRAKIIELVFGIVQNAMQYLPGYAGRNERIDRYEEVEKLILDVRAGRVDPADHFYHADAWPDILRKIFEEYNDEPQSGDLKGLSPNEAYRAFANPIPPVKFTPEMACLFNPYIPATITRSRALTFRYGKQKFVFANEELGQLIGRNVIASFDPEDMSHVAVTPDKWKTILIVPRLNPLNRINATKEEMKTAFTQVDSFHAYGKARHRILDEKRENIARELKFDAASVRQISGITSGLTVAREQTHQKQKRQTAIEANATAAGITITEAVMARPSSAGALERLASRRRARAESKESNQNV